MTHRPIDEGRPERVKWRPDDRRGLPHELWRAADVDGTEYEVTDLIAALVRATKPLTVVETGTYEAQTSLAICDALRLNGQGGMLYTYEIDPERAAGARQRLAGHGHAERAIVQAAPLAPLTAPAVIGFAFLDSGMRDRQGDMDTTWPRLEPGGLVIVHDAAPSRPPGRVRPPGAFAMFDLATPRGLTLFQKPWI